MRIAIVGDYPLDEQKIEGGVQSALVNLVHSLSKTGKFDIHIIAPKKSIGGDISYEKDSIDYYFFPRFSPFELSFILGVHKRRIFKRLVQIKPEIVHAHDYEYSYLCINSPYPTIITPHGIPRLESKYRRKIIARWRYWLHGVTAELLLAQYAKNLILISEYTKKELKISKQARVFFIPNAVRSEFFMLKDREVKDRLLFTAADVSPRKNPLLLLKAVAALKESFPQISLHFVGYFSNDGFFNSIQEFVRQNQIEHNVHFMGLLKDDKLMAEYEECSVFVLTSEWENLPVVIKQAMAAGRAIIATRVGGVPEMLRDGVTGLLIAPGDVDSLTKGLEILLRDGELRGKIGRTAREEALKKYSGEVVARKTYQAYKTVLEERNSH